MSYLSSPSCLSQALTILKHKDPHESFTSHIFDLQSKFTSSTQFSAFTSWRDYALNLERECADLKSKIDLSQTKLLALSNLAGTTDTHYAISSDQTSKRKRITSSTGKRDNYHIISSLQTTLAELADENHPTGREPATFFMALDNFAQLASLHEHPDFPVDIFVSATQRVIHAASDVLHSILETNQNLNTLELLHKLMQFVIEISFQLLPLSSESFGYLLFNQLSGLLLSPVIRSFFPLSIISLGYLLEPVSSERQSASQNGPDLHIDCRPKFLEFFQGIVSGLFSALSFFAKTNSGESFCQDASSMRDILILETIRHLKEVLFPIPVDKHSPDATGDGRKKKTIPQAEQKVGSCIANLKDLRVRRLAVKDAMWYLCSVFHILIGSKTPVIPSSTNSDNKLFEDSSIQQAGSEILEKRILRELFELLIDHEKSRLSFGASQTLVGAGIMGTAVKTALLTSECQNPIQEILTSNKQAKCFESNHEIYTRPFDHVDYHDLNNFSNHGPEAINGIVTEANHMHHVLDDAECGMLLCVVERYVNDQ